MMGAGVMLMVCCGAALGGPDPADNRGKRLSEKLRSVEEESPKDVMADVVERMQVVADRLGRDFDPGEETQALQRRIVADLERAIEASIRRGEGGDGRSKPSLDRREKPGAKQRRKEKGKADKGESVEGVRKGAVKKSVKKDQVDAVRDRLRGWGALPERDRDEVIQGSREQSVPRFRKWIERYYRALAEEGDE